MYQNLTYKPPGPILCSNSTSYDVIIHTSIPTRHLLHIVRYRRACVKNCRSRFSPASIWIRHSSETIITIMFSWCTPWCNRLYYDSESMRVRDTYLMFPSAVANYLRDCPGAHTIHTHGPPEQCHPLPDKWGYPTMLISVGSLGVNRGVRDRHCNLPEKKLKS